MQRLFGWSEQGSGVVQTSGQNSSNNTLVQRSFPGATVTVHVAGGNNLATIYSDNNGTPLANPFTASNSGYWDFYAAAGRYDVQFSNNGIVAPFTLPDISLGAVQSINGQSGENINILVGNNGNNFNISANNNNITLNLPKANANNSGYLSAADWASFNSSSPALNYTAPLSNNNGTVSILVPLPIVYGGSNASNKTQAFDNLSPQSAKGDIITFDGNNAIGLPVGNNNLALIADGSNNGGLKWSKVDLTAGVQSILPIASGGSNANNASQAFTNLSPITTKGDIIVGNNNAIPDRLPVGANNQVIIADSTQATGMAWGNMNLAGGGVTGVLPSSRGGTGGNNNAQGFNLLAPTSNNGDMIVFQGATNIRLPIGNNNALLSANNNNAVWIQPAYQVQKFTIASNNNAFVANTLTADLPLFTLGQYQKVTGVTVKPSVLFLNANNSVTDVTVSVGVGGNSNLFSANFSVGNNGVVGNSNFQDTSEFKSGNMGGNQAVLAHFIAAGANFGNGANTVLISGSVDIWVAIVNLQ